MIDLMNYCYYPLTNSAIKTGTPTLVSSATSDAATDQQDINIIKNKNVMMYHPGHHWLTEASML